MGFGKMWAMPVPLDVAPDPISYAPVAVVVVLAILAAVVAILMLRAFGKRR